MEVESVHLIDFRNYVRAKVEFADGFNLIVGRNGRGKTNLLEAVYVLSALASHRTSTLSEIVRHGEERAIVRSSVITRGRGVSIDAEFPVAGRPRLLINKAAPEGSRSASEVLAAVLFSPEDLGIVKGMPEERRRFLDHAAAKAHPRALSNRRQFERILRQRNGVLRAGQINPRALQSLDVWDQQFAEAASAVVADRLSVLDSLGPAAQKRYEEVSTSEGMPDFIYRPSWAEDSPGSREEIAALIALSLEENRGRDLERGLTRAGPHRDDLLIRLEGIEARAFASQGEQRSLALALRLAERDLLSVSRGEEPVLLLDDVFSELDDLRRAQLAELVGSGGQSIATATGTAGVPIEAARLISINEPGVIDA